MNNRIKHSGVVESIEDGCVHVRIVQTAACAACKVASRCNAAESKEKVIDVYRPAKGLNVGDVVTVTTSGTVAARALLWGFGMPFVVLVAVLVVVFALTGNEAVAALSGLAALAPYYALLYLFRGQLKEQLAFAIE